jgi:hypothetical protein
MVEQSYGNYWSRTIQQDIDDSYIFLIQFKISIEVLSYANKA